MAVYRRNYKPYAGRLTPEWSRCLVLFRYSRRNLFRSKFLTGLFVVCFFYPLICLLMIYLAHNASFLQQLGVPAGVLSIDNKFFFNFISVQGVFAFLLTAFAGPGLISPDLANGALPLYFCRPFSRAEYVLGKSSVLAILLSQITWVPGLILFAMQAGLAGASWTWSNLWIAGSLILSSLIWIAILSLLAMALSAWVKWRIVAGALLLGVMFFGAGFAQAINAVMRTDSGHFFNVAYLMGTVWNLLRHLPLAAHAQSAGLRGDSVSDRIVFEDVSKFYGEILGVNRVNLSIPPGITSLVGPNGSGKTTLMNLMTGLVRPTRGRVEVLGYKTDDPENLFKILGYSTQFDAFPKGLTGFQFIYSYLRLAGRDDQSAEQLAWRVIERVNLVDAAKRNIAGYSKGMRQRIRLAQAIAHDPKVLVLDEPLNGLDPLARSEMIALFRATAAQGCYVIISSHILHEVDVISDQVILLSNGYVVAEGQIATVRGEIQEHPTQILIRCTRPRDLAAKMLEGELAIEVSIHKDEHGLLLKTRDADRFYLELNQLALNGIDIESIAPADDDVLSVYEYLIGNEEAVR
jgi:ABC-2 type transport system ATP-binding protein